jgi:hypothetical protein
MQCEMDWLGAPSADNEIQVSTAFHKSKWSGSGTLHSSLMTQFLSCILQQCAELMRLESGQTKRKSVLELYGTNSQWLYILHNTV